MNCDLKSYLGPVHSQRSEDRPDLVTELPLTLIALQLTVIADIVAV
jgi:hypothetical protein